MARHNEIGSLGERIAAEFLESKSHRILIRNYRKPYGEIDIVSCETSGLTHFVEVKTVSWETGTGVSHETLRPEENVHPMKIKRLRRVIQVYLSSRNVGDWQFDVVAVLVDRTTKRAKVRWLKNVII